MKETGVLEQAAGLRLRMSVRSLTPSKQGFRALKKHLREIARTLAARSKTDPAVMSIDLTLKSKGQGERMKAGIGIPRWQDVVPKPGQSKTDALVGMIFRDLQKAVFATMHEGSWYRKTVRGGLPKEAPDPGKADTVSKLDSIGSRDRMTIAVYEHL